MAASFKLSSLTRKWRRGFEFPEFSWSSVKIKEELESGTFGTVYLADFAFVSSPVLSLGQTADDS